MGFSCVTCSRSFYINIGDGLTLFSLSIQSLACGRSLPTVVSYELISLLLLTRRLHSWMLSHVLYNPIICSVFMKWLACWDHCVLPHFTGSNRHTVTITCQIHFLYNGCWVSQWLFFFDFVASILTIYSIVEVLMILFNQCVNWNVCPCQAFRFISFSCYVVMM